MDAFLNRLTTWNEERNKAKYVVKAKTHIYHVKECKRIQLERRWLRRLVNQLLPEPAHTEMVIRYLGMGAIYLTPQAKGILELRQRRIHYNIPPIITNTDDE